MRLFLKTACLLALVTTGMWGYAQPAGRQGFNDGWEFEKEGEAPRTLDLPHDWGVESEFDITLPGASGKLPWWGRAVYRKHLNVSEADLSGSVFLEIDGAMAFSSVRCNGEDLGGWPYGYASYRIDLTPALRPGDNCLEIHIDNKEESSRWYPGGGIYRNVWITRSPKAGIAHWGTFAAVPEAGKEKASVLFNVELRNAAAPCPGEVTTTIFCGGRSVARRSDKVDAVSDSLTLVQEFTLDKPRRWSPEDPVLYEAVTTVTTEYGTDTYKTVFGIREAVFTPEGFFLNGQKTFLKGVCLHHDAGALGAAWNDDAWIRRLGKLKEMGCNAIRSAHNPPAPELLDLCDRMGFLVMDELSDTWSIPKKPNGYALLFDQWIRKDMTALLRRDRNHPSVILWSIGNEVPEQGYADKWQIADSLTAICHREDPWRMTTSGNDNLWASTQPWHETVDVYGFNYKPHAYAEFHAANPDQPYLGSETASCISTRGFYTFPVSEDKADGRADFQVSSYDYAAPYWASSAEYEWRYEDITPSVAGEFVWTGYDYLGEPTPYNEDLTELSNFHDPAERARAEEQLRANGRIASPSRSSYFGILDLAGFPKDRYYAYQARWNPSVKVAHILPHWTWPGREGQVTPIHVYTSGDSAELFVNGKSQGMKQRGPDDYRLRWDEVIYEPGTVKVVAYKNGKKWATESVRTAGAPYKVKLRKDYAGKDLVYITAVITDRRGNPVPQGNQLLRFSVRGKGVLIATDSGDPTDLQGFQHPDIKAFNGLSSVIIRRTGRGPLRVSVQSDELRKGRITVW